MIRAEARKVDTRPRKTRRSINEAGNDPPESLKWSYILLSDILSPLILSPDLLVFFFFLCFFLPELILSPDILSPLILSSCILSDCCVWAAAALVVTANVTQHNRNTKPNILVIVFFIFVKLQFGKNSTPNCRIVIQKI